MMGWRIAYCKINYPLAYYCAFFSIRASAFSYEIMCLGREHLERVMAEYRKRSDSLSNKEQEPDRINLSDLILEYHPKALNPPLNLSLF